MSNIAHKKIVFSNGFEIFKDHSTVPIDVVAESLGVDITKDGKMRCPCPNHADNNPSAVFNISGRYENKFHCFSCGESGDPLNLVMAVKSGITPSDYYKAMKGNDLQKKFEMIEARNDAALYLNEMFPGIIEVYNSDAKITKKADDRPKLPAWIEENLGLPKFFDKPFVVKIKDQMGNITKESGQLSKTEAADLVLGKLVEFETNLIDMKETLYKICPDIKENTAVRLAINESINKKLEVISEYQEKYRDYLKNEWSVEDHSKEKKEATPWASMSDEDFMEAFKNGMLDGIKDDEENENNSVEMER